MVAPSDNRCRRGAAHPKLRLSTACQPMHAMPPNTVKPCLAPSTPSSFSLPAALGLACLAVLSELYSRSCTLRRLHGSITLRRQHHMHLLQQARLVASPTITPPACRPPPAGQHEGVCHAQTDSCMSTPPAPATCHESCQSPKSCLSPPPAPATSTRPPVSLSPHPLTPLSLSLRIQPAPAPEPAREQVGGGCERERPSARERGRALCVCVFRCVFQ